MGKEEIEGFVITFIGVKGLIVHTFISDIGLIMFLKMIGQFNISSVVHQ